MLGIYYLTQERPGVLGEGKFFKNVNEAILAYENQVITLHSRINVRVTRTTPQGEKIRGNVESTLGRFLFNEILPQDLGFVERNTPEDCLKLEVDFHVGKKQLKQILEKVINTHGASRTAEVLDDVKAIGYKYSTRAAMTVSISDMTVPAQKAEMLAAAQSTVDKIAANYRRGLITEEERYRAVVERTTAYYEACNQAQADITSLDDTLAAIYADSFDEEEYFMAVGHKKTCTFTISDLQTLSVTLDILYPRQEGDPFYRITSWQVLTDSSDMEEDEGAPLLIIFTTD